jgi:molecular chaperone GrpE
VTAPGSPEDQDLTGGESPQDAAAPRPGGPRPGGSPEDHAPAHSFGDEAGEMANGPFETPRPSAPQEPTNVNDGSDQAASDELALAQTALAERTLDLQRLQAEFLNYKRRVDRDRDLVKQNAVFGVLSGLLPVLDDIDRAREHGELEGGFKAVADSLERTVAGLGLTKYAAKGDPFDPHLHEALMHGHSPDVTTTTVDVVAHAGYRFGDRVLRAAKVTVLDPGTSETES